MAYEQEALYTLRGQTLNLVGFKQKRVLKFLDPGDCFGWHFLILGKWFTCREVDPVRPPCHPQLYGLEERKHLRG